MLAVQACCRHGRCRMAATGPHSDQLEYCVNLPPPQALPLSPVCVLLRVCIYYCSPYYKAVRVGGGG